MSWQETHQRDNLWMLSQLIPNRLVAGNSLITSATTESEARLLNQFAAELLAPDTNYVRQCAAVRELYSLCAAITRISADSNQPDDLQQTQSAGGQAISPQDAAACLLDVNRTVRFLRGIDSAIRTARIRFPHPRIEILYAGCGPFAPFALPFTSRFNPDEIQFTLIDLHQKSLDAAQSLFESFGRGAFVRAYQQADAATYRHDGSLHLVITETMQRALEKEPQVGITMNLAPQLCAGGVFVPEKIAIDACLIDLQREFPNPVDPPTGEHQRIHLGRLLELTAEKCRDSFGQHDAFPPVALTIPSDIKTNLHLMLATTISVFDSVVIGEYESGLTQPLILHDLGTLPAGARVEFQYRLNEQPGFIYRLV